MRKKLLLSSKSLRLLPNQYLKNFQYLSIPRNKCLCSLPLLKNEGDLTSRFCEAAPC